MRCTIKGAATPVLKGSHRALKRDGVYRMQDLKGSSHVYEHMVAEIPK